MVGWSISVAFLICMPFILFIYFWDRRSYNNRFQLDRLINNTGDYDYQPQALSPEYWNAVDSQRLEGGCNCKENPLYFRMKDGYQVFLKRNFTLRKVLVTVLLFLRVILTILLMYYILCTPHETNIPFQDSFCYKHDYFIPE